MRKIAISEEQIGEVVRQANATKDARLRRLAAEKRSLQHRIQEVRGKIAPLIAEIESGMRSRSLSERLMSLESDRESIEEQLASSEQEIEAIATETRSTQLMVENYRDLPMILDRLEETEDRQRLKGLIPRFVHVIEWHQDEKDPASGTVEIELFAEAYELLSCTSYSPDATSVNAVASGRD